MAASAHPVLCTVQRTILVLFLLAIGAGTLHAQMFQRTFGDSDPLGQEFNAVIQTSGGDYMLAGSAYLNGKQRMYVKQADPDGNGIWHSYYGFDGPCAATDVKEFPNGDFVIVGWTDAGSQGRRQGIVMRIEPDGTPVWSRMFWIEESAVARSVVVTQNEDIFFAGNTVPIFTGTFNGMLGRLDGNGTMNWVLSYNLVGASGSHDDWLYSIDESIVQTASGTTGDIVAAGASFDGAGGNPGEVWVLRVNPKTGVINSSPQGSALFGSADDDIAYAIRELRHGGNPGDLVITGRSDGRPFPSTGAEGFIMQITADPCYVNTVQAATYFGDNSNSADWGTSLKEIKDVGTQGNIMVGGTTTAPGFGGIDGFIQEFEEGSLAPVGQYLYYGSWDDDEILSIDEAPIAPNTPGYVFAGVTKSPTMIPSGNTRNAWFAKTDGDLYTACNYEIRSVSDAPAPWFPSCLPPVRQDDVVIISVEPEIGLVDWEEEEVCYEPFKTVLQGDGLLPDPAEVGKATMTLSSYPNPVRRENRIMLGYSLAAPGTAQIIVTDAAGEVRYEKTVEAGEREGHHSISTAGWSPGTYLARITADGVSATTKVVLLER